MIPCKKDKCILLPVCKNKVQIKCPILFRYYMIEINRKGSESISIKKEFPDIMTLGAK